MDKLKKGRWRYCIIQVIEITPSHWFSLKNKEIIPDVTYAFFQTLELKYGIFPKNKAEVKFIRSIFHEIYIEKYKGVYKLDLENTFNISNPLINVVGIKLKKYYKKYVTYSKNVSLSKRLKNIRNENKKIRMAR